MKRLQFVADDICVVALAGLRIVSKDDQTWASKTSHSLELNYKGTAKSFRYHSPEKRDAMYEAIRAELTKI